MNDTDSFPVYELEPTWLRPERLRAPSTEDFFDLDRLLDEALTERDLQLGPSLRSILVRTVIAAETRDRTITCSVAPEQKLHESGYLGLCYSRFFEVAPQIAPPPGPHPRANLTRPELIRRHGILFRRSETVLVELLQRYVSHFMDTGLLGWIAPDRTDHVSGIRIVSHPEGTRLLAVHEVPESYCYHSGARIGVDLFERSHRDARYWPGSTGMAVAGGLLCFRRRERRCLLNRYVAVRVLLSQK